MAKSRTLLTVALASMALVLVAGPVVGHKGEGDTHRGKIGRHAFRDSDLKPGARCIYREVAPAPTADESDAAMELVGVSVRAPKVAAINRTRRIDRRAARFSRLAIRYDGNPKADYRVVAKAYWLKNRNPLKKVGVATHLVDHYKVRGVVSEASCSGDGSVPVSETP